MSKYKEDQCDTLVQQICCLAKSQWSGYPAECGHHIIGRTSIVWRWRLMNIAPLTIEEHGLTHAGKIDSLHTWQKEFHDRHSNDALWKYLQKHWLTRDEFANQACVYLKQVKHDIEQGITTLDKVVKQERELYDNEN
jgi:hypothetical protein